MDTPRADQGPDQAIWAGFRDQMPIARRWAYFDHAAVAPLSGPAQEAIGTWLSESTLNGATGYPSWISQMEQARSLTAQMLNAHTDEIALIHNTSAGINLVAEGFPWKSGDNVVIRADEFPSNQYPWLQLAEQGVEIRRIPTDGGKLDLAQLAATCDSRTRIVSISWVTYSGGWRHDVDRLAEIAHGCGALLFLDAIQGLGVFPLDVSKTPVDFLSADGHKWLLGPEGAGVFYIRREHLRLLKPLSLGWNSVVDEHNFANIDLTLKETAERYEGGSPSLGGLIGLAASLDLLCRLGAEAIGRRIVEVTDLACERLKEVGAVICSDREPGHESGIVVFEMPGKDPEKLRQEALQRDVVLSCRAGRLRISPHAYNDTSDIDRLIEAVS